MAALAFSPSLFGPSFALPSLVVSILEAVVLVVPPTSPPRQLPTLSQLQVPLIHLHCRSMSGRYLGSER